MATSRKMLMFLIFLMTVMTVRMTNSPDVPLTPSDAVAEAKTEEQVTKTHQTDSLTILMLLGLLLLTVLTIWLFKHRRFRFVHETGLSMIYGLIVGAIIRYSNNPVKELTAEATLKNFNSSENPETIYITRYNQTLKYDLVGFIKKVANEEVPLEKTVTFDSEIFFNIMLPIIIFEAGYSMKRRHFFRNIGAIMTYAFLGTTISFLVVGGIMYGLTRVNANVSDHFHLNDCFFFGAIISATDPVTVLAIFHDLNVDVDLYALVFGEAVLNDAVSIVLSGSVEEYSKKAANGEGFSAEAFFMAVLNFLGFFFGSFAIGSVVGCITALLTKFTKVRDFPLLETGMFFLMSYMSFQAAESAGLTGIVAVLFCGITQAHYTYNNLSSESRQRTKQLFEIGNFLAENFVFLYIGVSVFTLQKTKWDPGFIFAAFFAIIVARIINIYPLSLLLNAARKKKINFKMQHMMMFAGLRGALAFALSIRDVESEAHQLMVVATMMIVLVTVILCGGLTTPMLQWLQIRVGVEEEEQTVNSAVSYQRQYSTMQNSSEAQLQSENTSSGPEQANQEVKIRSFGKAYLIKIWYNFDMKYMKPFLTNSRPTLMDTLPKCCLPIAKLLTTAEQLSQGVVGGGTDGDSDAELIIDHSEASIGENSYVSPSLNSPTSQDGTTRDPLEVLEDDGGADNFDLEGGHRLSLRINLSGAGKGEHV